MKKVKAFSPASIGNFSVGFDTLGFAYNSLGDNVCLEVNDQQQDRIVEITNAPDLTKVNEQNCCTVVIDAIRRHTNSNVYVDVSIEKGIKPGSGLGSSAASSCAAAMAYNKLIGEPLSKEELILFAAEGERVACGTPILDNVSSAMLGGLVLMHKGKFVKLPLPKGVYAVSIFPQIELKTSHARKVLPHAYPLKTISNQMANVGAFIASLYQEDLNLLKSSFEDLIAEPYRNSLIPLFEKQQALALKNQAIGFGISGSGPSTFALFGTLEEAKKMQNDINESFSKVTIETRCFIENIHEASQGTYIC